MELDNGKRDTSDRNHQVYCGKLLSDVQYIINNDLLPDNTKININSRGVFLQFSDNTSIPISGLSDGYRSILALAIDLIRHLTYAFKDLREESQSWFEEVTGIVLIDELDVHLHPHWQRAIGPWLQRVFTHIQFIVATHSPFISQVADEDDRLYVLQAKSGSPPSVYAALEPTVRGWRADQIFTSDLFGLRACREIIYRRRGVVVTNGPKQGTSRFLSILGSDHTPY